MEQVKIEDLIERYFKGLTSAAENKQLQQWYDQVKDQQVLHPALSRLSSEQMEALRERSLQQLLQDARKISRSSPGNFKGRAKLPGQKRIKLMAAAAILLLICCCVAAYLSWNGKNFQPEKTAIIAVPSEPGQNIHGGRNAAVLHLSNGQTIQLDSSHCGVLAEQNGVKILQDKNGLVYVGKAKQTLYNDITTARGQQWQLTLPDGTKVWLNAASSIHYPLTFNGDERVVRITGEVYFEVVHNSKQPFKVKASNTVIEDIGTDFNVTAYQDEPRVKTTLIHGSVKVISGTHSSLLVPGQQALTGADHRIQVQEVNTDYVTGWIKGEMNFNNEDLEQVMRRVARWYDINVVYAGAIPKRKFVGSISRKINLSAFLKLLAFENVDFTLEGKQITIRP